MISFPDYEYFNDVGIAYSDFIQRVTLIINEIAPCNKIRIKNYSHDWLNDEILGKIILRDKFLKKFEASILNNDEQLHKEVKIKYRNLLKTRRELYPEKFREKLVSPRSYENLLNLSQVSQRWRKNFVWWKN